MSTGVAERAFQSPCVYLKELFEERSHALLSQYNLPNSYIRSLALELSLIPEFLGYETYLMFEPDGFQQAKEMFDLIFQFHVGFMVLNEYIDSKYPVAPDLYVAVGMIIKTGNDLLKMKNGNVTIYNYYVEHLEMLIKGCYERELLSESSSFEEYEEVVNKIANGYEMVVIVPAYLAEMDDKNTISLRGYIRSLYRALHLIDDIRDMKEDSTIERANYMSFFRSVDEAKEYGVKNLESSSRYIKEIDCDNYHKEYLWWISKKYFQHIIARVHQI